MVAQIGAVLAALTRRITVSNMPLSEDAKDLSRFVRAIRILVTIRRPSKENIASYIVPQIAAAFTSGSSETSTLYVKDQRKTLL
jgi:hypothetical protein